MIEDYFNRRRKNKIDSLRNRYPMEISEIERVAQHNSDMELYDVEEYILDLDSGRSGIPTRIKNSLIQAVIGEIGMATGADHLISYFTHKGNMRTDEIIGGLVLMISSVVTLNACKDIIKSYLRSQYYLEKIKDLCELDEEVLE